MLTSEARKDWLAAGIVSAFSAALYISTAARDIIVGDTPEFVTVAVTLGVAHPPGYPLFTMLGHLFSWLPFKDIPFRVNLSSCVCNVIALNLIFFTALRLSKSRPAALIAAVVLAVNPLFWTWSLAAEVFALNNLLASLMIYLLVRWHEEPERTGFFVGACFVAGLGLSHHQTLLLLGPACLFVVWQGRSVLLSRPHVLVMGALVFAAGFTPYLYVLWAAERHPFYNWGNISSLRDLWHMIARKGYGTRNLVPMPEYLGGSNIRRLLALCSSFGALLGLLALLGLVASWRRQRWYFWFVLLAFGFAGLFFVSLTRLNLATAPSGLYVLERFFILPQVIIAPLVALGIALVASYGSYTPRLRRIALALTGIVVIAGTVATNYRRVDQSDNRIARSFAEDVLASVEPGTVLLASGDSVVLPLTYLQAVEHARPDVAVIMLSLLPGDWYLGQLRERHPDLKVPFDHYDPSRGLKLLIDANPERAFALIGMIPNNDNSLSESYRFRTHGLVSVIEPSGKNDMTVDELAADNGRLLARYKPPSRERINSKSFETEFLSLYALPPAQIGGSLEKVGRTAEARSWYQRAFELDPNLPQLREALARVSR